MLLLALSQLNNLRPVVSTVALLGVSPTVLLVHTSWRVISLLLPKKMFYPVEDAIWGWYQKFVVFVFEACTGVKVVIKGDIPGRVENAVLICNHQTSMDWIVTDFLALRQGMVGHMRYIFKNILKYFPLYGYVWGVHGGVFVKRDGTYNAKKMKDTFQMLKDKEVPLYLVIYPEGTRFHPTKESVIAKSRAYAQQNNLQPLTHVLTPRVRGFHCALRSLGDYLDAVYDATIIYERKGEESVNRIRREAPTMWDVLAGNCERIFIQFDRIPARDVPLVDGTETPTFKWLHTRFQLKDELLKKFYSSENNNSDKDSTNLQDKHVNLSEDSTNLQDKHVDLSDMGVASPKGDTIIASASLVGLTAFLLSTPTGRMVYTGTMIGGSTLGMLYAHMFL